MVNYRPEYQHGWGGKSVYSQFRLDPLPPESAEELLRALLGEDASLDPLEKLLIERTEGNPFFLEECVRTLVETQVLVGERGTYRLARALPSIQVPATVQTVLAARIDRLPLEEKRLLQSASAIGTDVPLPILQAIAEPPAEELHRCLAHLQAAEFLYEASLFPELEYTFRHALTHEVAYGSLLQERRRALHARIVEAIEQLYPERLTEQVERLANHAFLAEQWEKALGYLRQAGAKAAARSAHREAVVYFEQALGALLRLPESRDTLQQAIDVRLDLRTSLVPLGEPERTARYLREAEGLARLLDDRRRLGWVSAYMCYYLLPYDPAEGRTFGTNARAIGEMLGDLPLQVAANYYVGLACHYTGDYRQAEEAFRNAMGLLKGDPSQERCGLVGFPVAVSRSWLAASLANLGAFDEAIAYGTEGLRLAEAFDHTYTLIIACRELASVYGLRGLPGEAARLLERGLALARDRHVADLAPGVTGRLGHVYALSGRTAEGLTLLKQAVELNESTGRRGYHSLLVTYLGEACVLAHRVEDALAFAGQALTHARERGERGHEAYALRLLGEISSRREPPDLETAKAHFRQALALADELGMRPLLAHCHLGLGRVFRRTVQPQQAREHLLAAVALFREMDMPGWPREGEEELQALP